MNYDMIRALKERIEADPERFNMDHWFLIGLRPEDPPCGTAACLAGTLALMHFQPTEVTGRWPDYELHLPAGEVLHMEGRDLINLTANLLGITKSLAEKITDRSYWPEKYDSLDTKEDSWGFEGAIAILNDLLTGDFDYEEWWPEQ